MFIYVVAVTLAAFIQIWTIYFLRGNFLKTFLFAVPLILIFQFLFLWSYSNAPKFITIWFLTTALTNSLAFLTGYFLWKEQTSVWNLVGIALIVLGVFFLRIK